MRIRAIVFNWRLTRAIPVVVLGTAIFMAIHMGWDGSGAWKVFGLFFVLVAVSLRAGELARLSLIKEGDRVACEAVALDEPQGTKKIIGVIRGNLASIHGKRVDGNTKASVVVVIFGKKICLCERRNVRAILGRR